MKKLIIEEVKVRPEARSNQSRQCVSQFRFILVFRLIATCLLPLCRSREDILASPIRDGRLMDGATSGHYGGQTPQQGGVSAGRRPESPVIDVRVPGVKHIKSEMEDAHVGNKVQIIDDHLDHLDRLLSLNLCSAFLDSDIFTGTHLRDRFLQWLSPSDPSTNHNVTCSAHNDTAQWFFQDSIYNEWKSFGSFLWVRGKRALLLVFIMQQPPNILISIAGSGKSVLWFVLVDSFRPAGTNINPAPQLYKISQPCTLLGGPRWPIFTLIPGMSKSKDCPTCFRLSSVSFRPGPIPVAIYSPDSILRTMKNRNLVIAL